MKQVLAALFVLAANLLNAQPLSERLDAWVRSDALKMSETGVTVFDLTEGKLLYAYQDEKLFRPASVEKIITSVTALARLGENFSYDTKLCYTGTIRQDTLHGSLFVVGGFDPLFSDEDLNRLADAVIANGIRVITDTLAADVSMMDSVYWGPGWSWDDAPYSFQPYLSPLMLNGGCVDVTVSPRERGTRAAVDCKPFSDYYRVDNRSISDDPNAGRLKITRNWLSNGNIISVTGNVTRTVKESLSVVSSERFFLRTFLNRLHDRGVSVSHIALADCPAPTAEREITTFFTWSRPLREVLKQALKESDNLCAESMFYQLAANQFNRKRLTAQDGTDAINTFMDGAIGMNPDLYHIADGSGVSLYNYISPRLMLEYLKYAYYHRDIFLPFYDALPIAGVDGTLKHRMKGTKAQYNVHAKTGSVKGVSSLAGFIKAVDGHQLAFVIIHQNIMQLRSARAVQDKICIELAK